MKQPEYSKVDGIIVLGRGNSLNGPSELTLENADFAILHLLAGRADFTMATGYGPDADVDYPVSEAGAIAERISSVLPEHPIFTETDSTNTFENILNIKAFFEEQMLTTSGLKLAIVAGAGHAKRAASVARIIMPETSFNVWPSYEQSFPERSREAVQRLVTYAVTRSVQPADEDGVLKAAQYYDQLFGSLKGKKITGRIHSGR